MFHVIIFVIMGLSCNFFLSPYARDAGLLRILRMYTVSGNRFVMKCKDVFPGGLLKRKQNGLTANSLFLFLAFS